MTGKLYIETSTRHSDTDSEIYVSIESYVALYVYRFCDNPSTIELHFIENDAKPEHSFERILKINADEFPYKLVKLDPDDHEGSDLKKPVFVQENTSIAGLCAVCRQIVMEYEGEKNRRELLGFKESCLLAPAECSVWTKFCEVDIIEAVRAIHRLSFVDREITIPNAFSRFEIHMAQPVRIHNIYKLARRKANETVTTLNVKAASINSKSSNAKVLIQSSTPREELNIDHVYAEGCYVTLADVIIYACYSLCFEKMPANDRLEKAIPLTFAWFNNVTQLDDFQQTFNIVLLKSENPNKCLSDINYIREETENCSLYKSDPKRYKPRDRIYTRQECVEDSLEQFARLNISATSESTKHYNETSFICDSIVFDSYPEIGDLPEKRILRKKQQLENLTNAVISVAKNGDRIIDFCCGSGHLGIILASALPMCHIIFLENKAISLARARDRAEKLNLKNCSFYQSNLDYFVGKFEIGASLHACGTATDIVIDKCIRSRAKFVCCPCCYGSVASMPHISYPLSKTFNTVMDEKDYLYIAHAADQAHNAEKTECNREKSIQGQFCMDIIDTDRKLMAEEAGYSVVLTRLQPEDCTPKNRLLLGII